MTLVGHPEVIEEEWFAKAAGRAAHVDLLDGYVAEWIAVRTADEVTAAFERADAAVAPVYTAADLLDDPQVQALEMITTVDDPDLGELKMQNVLFRMSETPGRIRHTGRSLGADTEKVLSELGVGAGAIEALREAKVIA
jgi:crotonobetainyl-CoA:carnitine CoA-transferase CaiB-like acyl-CoA transferase